MTRISQISRSAPLPLTTFPGTESAISNELGGGEHSAYIIVGISTFHARTNALFCGSAKDTGQKRKPADPRQSFNRPDIGHLISAVRVPSRWKPSNRH